jgi:hypothetical protein
MWHSAARDPIRRKRLVVSTILTTFGCLTTSISVFAQASDQVVASSTGDQTPYHLKVTSNLVVVRVVVRDGQNKPVKNLQKEVAAGRVKATRTFWTEFVLSLSSRETDPRVSDVWHHVHDTAYHTTLLRA